MKKNRIKYGTSLDEKLLRKIEHLAVDERCGVNELLEEGMRRIIQARARKKPPSKKEGRERK